MSAAKALLVLAVALAPAAVEAGGIDELHAFLDGAKNGRATFTQTVVARSGRAPQLSSGTFAFARPGKFRWSYEKPYEQLVVGDGARVWVYDRDLNQVIVRELDAALGATPAALLAGGDLEKDFVLTALPDRDGLAWVEAKPRADGGTLQSVRVGFRGKDLAAIEIRDAFGQTSLLQFSKMVTNQPPVAANFRFTIPPGADVIEQ